MVKTMPGSSAWLLPRMICGSLYLAGRVLAAHGNEEMTKVSGAGRR
jgi:hypothetical protein